jgi:hypothetical protein
VALTVVAAVFFAYQ